MEFTSLLLPDNDSIWNVCQLLVNADLVHVESVVKAGRAHVREADKSGVDATKAVA